MTYSHQLRGLGATGDRFAVGQEVTARFVPHGVNAGNQVATLAALNAAIARTGVFNTPTYLGWGADANAGLVVLKAKTKTNAFTAQQIANKMPAVIADVTNALGAGRLSFSDLKHPTPTGPATAAAGGSTGPAPAPAPEEGSAWAPSTEEERAQAQRFNDAERERRNSEGGFFEREVGGIPVWAIGAGVLVLGAGLVLVAMKKRASAAPTLMVRNARSR